MDHATMEITLDSTTKQKYTGTMDSVTIDPQHGTPKKMDSAKMEPSTM